MATTHVWHLWPGRHWPASASEEAQFVTELRTLADGRTAPAERMDVTAVLNALRCGITVASLLRFAPGVNPAALLAAYLDLEARRSASVTSWERITASPTLATLTEHAAQAAQLMPVPVDRIAKAAAISTSVSLSRVVAAVAAEIAMVCTRTAGIEASLGRRLPPDEQAVALGVALHNPHEPGLWGHPFFLPPRVGALSPLRVVDLLEERAR